jgi:hypothetical protein
MFRRSLVPILALLSLAVAACASPAPSATPSSAPSTEPSPAPSAAAGQAEPAVWWVAPGETLGASTTTIKAILNERACASGQSPEGRVQEPVIEYTAESVTVTISVTSRGGAQDCPSNPEFPMTITLAEPLGERVLLDGGSIPPRDATSTP